MAGFGVVIKTYHLSTFRNPSSCNNADESTNWKNVKALDKAVNVPDALKRQLGMEVEVRGEE